MTSPFSPHLGSAALLISCELPRYTVTIPLAIREQQGRKAVRNTHPWCNGSMDVTIHVSRPHLSRKRLPPRGRSLGYQARGSLSPLVQLARPIARNLALQLQAGYSSCCNMWRSRRHLMARQHTLPASLHLTRLAESNKPSDSRHIHTRSPVHS